MTARRDRPADEADEPRYGTIITQDRYTGVYSRGEWLAFPEGEPSGNVFESDAFAGDSECSDFWDAPARSGQIGRGPTPDAALADMMRRRKA